MDNDPLVLVHARALLDATAEGASDYVDADLREPDDILAKAAATLDFTRPVAVMLLGILHFIHDDGEARRLLASLLDAVPSGSHLVITHATLDFDAGESAQAEAQQDWNESRPTPWCRARARPSSASSTDWTSWIRVWCPCPAGVPTVRPRTRWPGTPP